MRGTPRSWVKAAVVLSGLMGLFAFAGCGGGGGGGGTSSPSSGTATVSSGSVSAVGSITVNGIRFEDNAARITGDNTNKVLADARRVGAVVKVRGTRNADGVTGTAAEIEIDNEVRGVITSKGADSFVVLGQTVVVDGATVFGNVAGFAALQAGETVEVHGFRDPAGNLRATRVERVGAGPQDELRGVVSGLTATSFNLNGMTVNFNAGTQVVPAGRALANGALVEVHLAGSLATLIEVEDALPEARQVEVEGLVSGFSAHPGQFLVAQVLVRTTSATRFEGGIPADLDDGVRVEAEGAIQGGVLVADKIQFKESLRIHDNAAAFTGSQVTLLNRTVLITGRTRVDGQAIVNGNGVEIRAFLNGDGTLTAVRATGLDRPIDADRKILQGPVSAFDAAARTLVILGITVDASGPAVELRNDDDQAVGAGAFFGALAPSRTVVKARGVFSGAAALTANQAEIE